MSKTAAGVASRVKEKALSTAGSRPKTMADQIQALVPQLARAIPKHMDPDKMARLALTEFRKNPALANCSPESFFGSLMTATQLGLEPGPLGHAYLIPYKGQVTLQIGYRGLLELVGRSDRVETVYAYPVYEGDEFNFQLGAKPDIGHKPGDEVDADKLTHVYAVAWIKNTSIPRIEVMTRRQVEAIRGRSAAASRGRSTPWDTDFAEMARKTVLKRLCKTLPLSVEIHSAIANDETFRPSMEVQEVENMFALEEGAEAPPAEAGDGAPAAEAGAKDKAGAEGDESPSLLD